MTGGGRSARSSKNIFARNFELFVSCSALGNTDQPTRKDHISPFCVLYVQRPSLAGFSELGRTETLCTNSSPSWTTSFELEFALGEERKAYAFSQIFVRADIYHQVLPEVGNLKDNELFGRATFSVQNLCDAPGRHFLTPLSHPTKERERVGILEIRTESLSAEPSRKELIEFDVATSILRKRGLPNKHVVAQSFEVFRAHANEDAAGAVSWLPIYRSDRLSKQNKAAPVMEFSRITVTNRHLCNGDESRRLRFVLHAGSGEKRPTSDMGYVDVTLRDLCEIDPTEEAFQIETNNEGDEVGALSLLKAEPTSVGSYFILKIDHVSNSRYYASKSSSEGEKIKNASKNLGKSFSRKFRQNTHALQRPSCSKKANAESDGYLQSLNSPLSGPGSVGSLFSEVSISSPESMKAKEQGSIGTSRFSAASTASGDITPESSYRSR